MEPDLAEFLAEQVRVVLVKTSHPGNIGSAARAMKTMGLKKLYLVSPQTNVSLQSRFNPQIKPEQSAIALAAGAADLLAQAITVSDLRQATADCGLIIALSARERGLEWPKLTPRECAAKVSHEAKQHPVALVFGPENSGLSNQELQQCHYQVTIPANPEYSSLNLAMAVQILTYELFAFSKEVEESAAQVEPPREYPTAAELEHFYHHLEKLIDQIGFSENRSSASSMGRLRSLFTRARLESREVNMLRGILTSIEKLLRVC